jgi:iron complex outermembrane receptor protein
MTNYHLRMPPMNPAMYRRNTTDVTNLGFSLALTAGLWRLGIDGHDERHNSWIDNPENPMFFVDNFNDAERRLVGLFVERNLVFTDSLSLELGVRYNRITSNAGEIDATPAMMGMPPAVALRDGFNNADREVVDDNLDLVAKLRYAVNPSFSLQLGAARKTRAPAYQERYLWLPLQATAGLADGRTYTGRVNLKSEIAREVEAGFDFENGRFHIAPRIFYRDVQDYIQGTTSSNPAAVMFVRMMNALNGTSNPDPLEFNNIDAEFYGIDLDWGVQLSERWSLEGVVNYVRGQTDSDDLYRIPPLNGLIALTYTRARWGASVETLFADGQSKVASFNGEPTSSGSAVFNLRGFWHATRKVRLSAGVDNLADRVYSDHLAGINRVNGNPAIAPGERLPAYGRNFFARLDLTI